MSNVLLISDAAKEVKVESHVLRYWEEELHLPIKRNELGHRYYTEEDVERFKQIKSMKERGLQLKAIKMILKDGKLNIMGQTSTPAGAEQTIAKSVTPDENVVAAQVLATDKVSEEIVVESKEDKSKRLQWLLQQLIRETLQENNEELCRTIKESVVKELDYQFRLQEERDEERERVLMKRNEEYYKKMDELLRIKSRKAGKPKKNRHTIGMAQKGSVPEEPKTEKTESTTKKKRHSIF
ncbi:MAG: MerR family transcriptional regulator [Lachnospiraceae bacterium]|nr:MerR family transcriptional regulator [Lachnospiraceae bacterium]